MKGSSKKTSRPNDFNYAVQVIRVILGMIGAWPIPTSASSVKRIAVRLQNVICYFLFAFVIVPGFLQIFLKEPDFKHKAKAFGPILIGILSFTKYSLLLFHAKGIQSCLKQARQDWKDTIDWENRKTMLSKAKTGRKFAIFSAVIMYVAGLSFRTIVPLSKGRMLTPMNTTVRALACPSYFVKFDGRVSPAYEFVFTLQFLSGLTTYSVRVGAVGLAAFFIMHVCEQLSIIMGKLQHLNNMPEPDDRTVAILLADIVQHQIKVKSFLTQVEETMRYVWLVEITSGSLLMCLAGYYIITEWGNDSAFVLTMPVFLVSFTLSVFTICYMGQQLTNQSIKIGIMMSTINWYRFQYKRARSLIMIIAISNIPAKVSAGRIIEMSLPTFNSAVNYSSISLLYRLLEHQWGTLICS